MISANTESLSGSNRDCMTLERSRRGQVMLETLLISGFSGIIGLLGDRYIATRKSSTTSPAFLHRPDLEKSSDAEVFGPFQRAGPDWRCFDVRKFTSMTQFMSSSVACSIERTNEEDCAFNYPQNIRSI